MIPVDWIAACFSIMGAYLIANKRWYGFVIAILSNFSWVTFGYLTGSLALQIESIIYFCINLYGIYFWKIKSKPVSSPSIHVL